MQVEDDMPVYPISVAAELINVHPRTLRIYEENGLLRTFRRSGKRLYSNNNITWIKCIRDIIHNEGISIAGLKRLMEFLPCWDIKNCSEEERHHCNARISRVKECWELCHTFCEQPEERCGVCETFKSAKND